jgi:arginine repressor
MVKTIAGVIVALAMVSAAYAAEDVVSAVHGTIKKIDSATKTVVIKTADGTEHSLRYLDSTAVHGAKASAEAGKDSWHGLTEGTEVVAHYTKRGTEDTALEVDRVDRDGLKMTKGTVKDVDRDTKKLVVETSDGAESVFQMTDRAAKDGGKDIAKGTEKGAKVTVYFTEDAGKKVAHFFE